MIIVHNCNVWQHWWLFKQNKKLTVSCYDQLNLGEHLEHPFRQPICHKVQFSHLYLMFGEMSVSLHVCPNYRKDVASVNVWNCQLTLTVVSYRKTPKLPVQITGQNIEATMAVKPTPLPSSKMVSWGVKEWAWCNNQSANSKLPRHICNPTMFKHVLELCSETVVTILIFWNVTYTIIE